MKTIAYIILLFLAIISAACQPTPLLEDPEVIGVDSTDGSVTPRSQGLPFNQYADRDHFYTDYVSYDLSNRDLRSSLEELLLVKFNSRTEWPEREYLPKGFDPDLVLEFGENPGLGIREIHQEGITGQGVSIAVIDTQLNVNHQEYSNRLVVYELIGDDVIETGKMHGTSVASLAVGETVGTAPGADLYFMAANIVKYDDDGNSSFDFTDIAEAIRHILEINEALPQDKKIRVISMSMGIRSEWADTTEVMNAIEEAGKQGIFVIYSNLEDTYGFGFHGLGRSPLNDPDILESFVPAIIQIEDEDFNGVFDESIDRLLVPMDSRSVADYGDPDGYRFDRVGGRSWAMPYIAGVYALGVQIDPNLTGERFWLLAIETSRTIAVGTEDGVIDLGPILNPRALIEALRK
jgi:subtilisin family serine protease